ncbi:MAG: hypothetical protein FWF13_05415, partial [Acidobacteria bacterium]|nr:hypothetical protein [Acidobacteriota bacterium]
MFTPGSLFIKFDGNKISYCKIAVSTSKGVHIGFGPPYHHRFTLYDPLAGVEFTDLLEIRTLELSKLPETPDVYL